MVDRPWQQFYATAYWLSRRRQQLKAHPLCQICSARGALTVATIVDHVEPHKGDWNLFVLGELQSLCKHCHDSSKRFFELHGHSNEIGTDGWPLDPNHPANRNSDS